jgi:branched-chain amino acid transport system substrate-binding protein
LLLERAIPLALKTAKPGTEAFRSALRDALENERDVVGCQGVFNISPTNHNGMDERARVLVTVRDGKFRLVPE